MVFARRIVLVVLGVASLALVGCVSNSQTFLGPKGEIKNCASTSQGQGLGGVLMANSRFNDCVDEIKSLALRRIEWVEGPVLMYDGDPITLPEVSIRYES